MNFASINTITEIQSGCILCGNAALTIVEVINTQLIVSSYKKQLNIDVYPYFKDFERITLYDCSKCGLRFYFPLLTGQSSFYEDLQKFDWYYQENKSEFGFCSRFTQNKSVLEIGCGEGFFSEYAGAHLYKGLEFNQQAINICRCKGLDVEKKSISEFSELHQEEYDVVCSFQVLEHVTDPFKFIKNAISCLKPGGLLLLSLPSEDSFVSLSSNNILNMPPHHLSRWQDTTFRFVEDFFDISLHAIHHEALDPIHYKWYFSTVGQKIVKKLCFKPVGRALDVTVSDKIISKLGVILGSVLKKAHFLHGKPPHGHSVTAVFEKL